VKHYLLECTKHWDSGAMSRIEKESGSLGNEGGEIIGRSKVDKTYY